MSDETELVGRAHADALLEATRAAAHREPPSAIHIVPYRDPETDEACIEISRIRVAVIEAMRTALVLDAAHAVRIAGQIAVELYRRGAHIVLSSLFLLVGVDA